MVSFLAPIVLEILFFFLQKKKRLEGKAGIASTDKALAIRFKFLQNDKLEFGYKKKDKLESLSLLYL